MTHASGYLTHLNFSVSVSSLLIFMPRSCTVYRLLLHVYACKFAGDCGQLPPVNDVYTIINQTNYTTEGSIVEFQCLHGLWTQDALNTTITECQSNGKWTPDPKDVCHAVAGMSYQGIRLNTHCCIIVNCMCIISNPIYMQS